jgi:autotransporter-associated beta strand protein
MPATNPVSMANRTLRFALLALLLAPLLTAHAGISSNDSSDCVLVNSSFFLSEPGPLWFRNALFLRPTARRQSVPMADYDRSGDRIESTFVGTLANPYETSLDMPASSSLAVSSAAIAPVPSAPTANQENVFHNQSSNSLVFAGNWSFGHVPTVSEDAFIAIAQVPFTVNLGLNGFLTVGSLDIGGSSFGNNVLTIRNENGFGSVTLTFGGAGNNGNSITGIAADLLYVFPANAVLNIDRAYVGSFGTGIIDVALGQSGNFNIAGTANISANISGTGFGLTKTGAGTLNLTGTNTYSGGTTISAGTLQINNAASLGNQSATATIGNGILEATADITTTRNFQLSDANSRISVDASKTFTISGTLTDGATAGTLNKIGTGTLALTGSPNTFTGGVNVNAGTLSAAVGSLVNIGGDVTVNSGGTLLLSGNGRHIGANTPTVLNGGTFGTGGFSEPNGGPSGLATSAIGPLTLTATSTIDFGSTNNSILEFGGLGTHTAGSVLQITNWDGTPLTGGSGDRLLFTGLATNFTTSYLPNEVTFDGVAGYTVVQFELGDNPYYEVVPLTAVPEPATWIGAGLAAASALALRVRRRKA